MTTLKTFIKSLRSWQSSDDVFNPWADYDTELDGNMEAPQIRAFHLENYLQHRVGWGQGI